MKQLQNHHLKHHALVTMKALVEQAERSARLGTQEGKMQYLTPDNTLSYGRIEQGYPRDLTLLFLRSLVKLAPQPYPQANHLKFIYGVFIRDKNVCNARPLVCSQLNGNNGEVTGDDDLAQPVVGGYGKKSPEELSDLERNRREAKNHTFSRSAGGNSKRSSHQINFTRRQNRSKKQGGTCVETEMFSENGENVVQQVETLTCYVIPSQIQMFEIQGAAYSSIPAGHIMFTGSEDFVPPGDGGLIGRKILVQSCGVGWFIRSSIVDKNRINYVTTTACTVLINDGFSYKDKNDRLVHVEAKEFIVYKPLFANLLKNVRSDALTDFVVKQGMMVATNQAYLVNGLPGHPIMLSTLEAYKHWLFRYGILQNSGQIRKFITLNYDTLGYHETQHALHEEAWIAQNHLLVDGRFSPWVEESITTDYLDLNSWVPRDDFKIIENVGVDISSGRFDFGYDSKFPPRFKITKFFSFEGLGLTPFSKHTRNNVNLSHGCKRLIGCRGTVDDEKHLRSRAVAFAHCLLDYSSNFECRMFLKCAGGRSHLYPVSPSLANFVRDSFDELKNRVTPHFFARKIGEIKTWLHTSKYCALEQWYQHNPFYGRELWAKIPHAKAKQRIKFVGDRHFHHEEYKPLTRMEVCIKDELGKCDKPCRLFLNLDSESAYAPTLPMHIKILLHGTHMHRLPIPNTNRYAILEIFIYAQPSLEDDEMDYIAQKSNDARYLEDYLFVALHSDDSIMVGNINGRSVMCNNDISSNDSGQDAPAFFGMSILQGRLSEKLSEGLLDLALLPIVIRSPTSEAKLKIQFNKPLEPSGHANTSCWNHLGTYNASLCIFHELVTTLNSLEQCVKEGAAAVGHVMTCDVCECIEDLQFLKFSPVECDGKYVMSANLGRLFRRLGMIDNDMTHLQLGVDLLDFRVMTPEERMNRFWSGVLKGYKNEPSNIILDALRTRFDSSRFVVTESALQLLQNEQVDSYYSHSRTAKEGDCTESVMRRYRLSSSEVDELVALIRDLTVGQRFKLTSVAKFFAKDYGVGTIKEPLVHQAIGTPGDQRSHARRCMDDALDMFEEEEVFVPLI